VVLMLYDWEKEGDFPKKSSFDYVFDTVDTPLFKRMVYSLCGLTMFIYLITDCAGG